MKITLSAAAIASVGLMTLASAAHAQLFTNGGSFTVNTENSPFSSSDVVAFSPGTTQLIDGGTLLLTISVINAPDFATTGAQWAVFSYMTPNGGMLSQDNNQNWSIEQVDIPTLVATNFIADFTQWTNPSDPINQISPIFGQTLMVNPVPGGTGNGEGTLGFVDPNPAGPLPQLGAFADPFQLVLNGLSGIPTGFTQALEFEPQTAITPGVPEPSTWVLMGTGFAALGFAAFRRRRGRASATFA